VRDSSDGAHDAVVKRQLAQSPNWGR
jgi:hypothetical protein